MIIKRGKAEIETVFEDGEHKLEDEITRKAFVKTRNEEELCKEGSGSLEN